MSVPNSPEDQQPESRPQIQQDTEGNQNQIIGSAIGSTIVNSGGGEVTIYLSQKELQPAKPQSQPSKLKPNPYKGLLAFQETDSDRFFGRSQQIGQLWQQFSDLYDVESTIRVLCIYGPSGSGKSSLARAGLIPELARRPLRGREKPRVAVLVPGTRPLSALATVLARVATNDPTPVEKSQEFERVLNQRNEDQDYEGLRRIADALPDIASSPLIVLVDQFEEIYTLCKDKAERDAFVGNLLHAAGDRTQRVSVILTLRSDFLGETQKHPGLNGLFSKQGFLVPAMTREELHQAIAEPAKQAGYEFDQATIGLLINQTEGREGALPLLQFALTRIWEGLTEGKEPAAILNEIRGVGGALAGEAQRIFDRLSPTEQDMARRVFLGLVQLGEGTKDTRRRVEVQQLVSHRDNPEQVEQVIARFSGVGARLITLAANTDGTNKTAEITHEALFDHWQQFQDWLDSSRNDLRFQRRLDEATQYWEKHGRPEGNLWRSPDLDLLRRYRKRAGNEMTPLQMEFFKASTNAAENQQRKEQQQRRFKKWTIRGVAVFSTSVISLAGFVLYALQQEQRQRVEQLAATSQTLLSSQPGNAVINAIAAVSLGQSASGRFPNAPLSFTAYGSLLDAIRINREQSLMRHEERVNSVAFSPDGKRIVSGGGDKTLRIWDAASGQSIGNPLKAHESEIISVAFSPDGKRIASGGGDKTIRIWDAASGLQIGKPLKGHDNFVSSVAFSPDGERIASGSGDNTVRIWDVDFGLKYGQAIVKPLKGHNDFVSSVAFSPDGKRIISGGKDRTVRIWDAASGLQIGNPLKGHQDSVMSVAFSPDGERIVSGSWDKTVRIWDAASAQIIGNPLKGHGDAIFSVVFSPDGKRIISGSRDKTVRIWDAASAQIIDNPLEGHEHSIPSVAFSPDGKRIVSGGRDATVRIWDATSGQPIGNPLKGHEFDVNSVAFSPDGKRIVSGSDDKTIQIWDATSGQPMGNPLKGHENTVRSVAFSPDGNRIVSGSGDATVRIWDAASGQPIGNPLKGHEELIMSVAFSPDGKRIVSGGMDNTVRIWDTASGQPIGNPLKGHESDVMSVAFSPDGKRIVSGSIDRTLRIWDASSGQLIGDPLKGHKDWVTSVAFSMDGKRIVSGSWDETVRIWDAISGLPIGNPLGDEDSVYSALSNPDKHYLKARLIPWEPRPSHLKSRKFTPPSGKTVYSVAFSPDGRIVSGGIDKTVRIWGVSWENLLQIGCKQLHDHPALTQPTTDTAKEAKQACEQYAWKR